MVARRVRITGRVQGVFFRAWMRGQAQALGVNGWVRNCDDGSVEAQVEGAEAAVAQLIALLHNGPPDARVEDVQLWNVEPCDFDAFDVRH